MAYSEKQKEDLFIEICLKIAVDGLALRNILKLKGMPRTETFYRWLKEDVSKEKRYAMAAENRADKIFEDILNIADATDNDVFINEDGVKVTNYNIIQRDRLRVDTRKWYLSKLNPKKYSDASKLMLGGNNDKPITISFEN